jgi:hypothetical protein
MEDNTFLTKYPEFKGKRWTSSNYWLGYTPHEDALYVKDVEEILDKHFVRKHKLLSYMNTIPNEELNKILKLPNRFIEKEKVKKVIMKRYEKAKEDCDLCVEKPFKELMKELGLE